jgi:hypothetical protein
MNAESGQGPAAGMTDGRSFGASVPIYGPKGDAPSIRADLERAYPVSSTKPSLPKQGGHNSNKPLGLFQVSFQILLDSFFLCPTSGRCVIG